MICELILNSGRTVRPVELKSITTVTIGAIKLINNYSLRVNGYYEIDPCLGNGQMRSPHGNEGQSIIPILVSQAVIDFLMQQSRTARLYLKQTIIDHERSIITLEIDIGLSPNESTTIVERVTECTTCLTHVCPKQMGLSKQHSCEDQCQTCQTHQCLTECESCLEHQCPTECETCASHQCPDADTPPYRNMLGDALIAIMSSYYSEMSTDEVMNKKLCDIIETWKRKQSKVEPSEGSPSNAWEKATSPTSQNATELFGAMLRLHEYEAQVEIIQGNEHDCTLMTTCPLNEINCGDLDDDILNDTLENYIRSTIAYYLKKTYFYTKTSKLGLSILARMKFAKGSEFKTKPLQIINLTIPQAEQLSPVVTKPDFKKRERKDSIISSPSTSKIRRKPT